MQGSVVNGGATAAAEAVVLPARGVPNDSFRCRSWSRSANSRGSELFFDHSKRVTYPLSQLTSPSLLRSSLPPSRSVFVHILDAVPFAVTLMLTRSLRYASRFCIVRSSQECAFGDAKSGSSARPSDMLTTRSPSHHNPGSFRRLLPYPSPLPMPPPHGSMSLKWRDSRKSDHDPLVPRPASPKGYSYPFTRREMYLKGREGGRRRVEAGERRNNNC